MADALTPAERAAIEAALDAGKVQRVPIGESGLDHLVWCPKARTLVHPKSEKRRWKPKVKPKGRPTGWTKEVTERRRKVAEMHQSGIPPKQISRRLGVAYETIRFDLREIKRIAA